MQPLNRREMEQLLTAGQGRGVVGEGSLKGRLTVEEGLPYLHVVGRDKRELVFMLRGPDQEVLPAYVDHKVSVSGLIRKTSNYGGVVEVRKYSAKRPEAEAEAQAAALAEPKLRFLSPGEISLISNPGMGAGMKGFITIRGTLETSGDGFCLVVSHAGTRQQVSFLLEGKGTKGLGKYTGHLVQVTGIAEKTSNWGGAIEVSNFEVKPREQLPVDRSALQVTSMELRGTPSPLTVGVNQGLAVRLVEKAGYVWAIEPMAAKRLGLRECNRKEGANGPAHREFFFTPRSPGEYEVEFFLAKALTPLQVSRTIKLSVTVKAS